MSQRLAVHMVTVFVIVLSLLGAGLGAVTAAPPASVPSGAAPPAPTTPIKATNDSSRSGGEAASTMAPFLGKRVIMSPPQRPIAGGDALWIGQARLADPTPQPTAVVQVRQREVDAAASEPSTPFYSVHTITLDNGIQLDEMTINGPPQPPPGYELERAPVASSALNRLGVASTLSVPAYDWVFGCSAVSAAMIGAYFDRNGLPNIYTGPTNGGIMPMDNSVWPRWTDSAGKAYPGNPLVASRNGSDGRTSRGSIDDYWVALDSTAPDPYITGGWAQHTWGDAFGDYMKTSQSAYGNTDGSTSFYTYTSSAAQLTCAFMESQGIADKDGTYGRKLFYQARGYTVGDCYNQKTDNNGGGFTFANYKALIDAGYPVLLNLAGHSIVGVGYADPSTVYIHDTWDYQTHSMTWGGSYSGMALLSVSVVNPTGAIPPTATPAVTPTPTVTRPPDPSGTLMSENFEATWPASGWRLYDWSNNDGGEYGFGKRNCHPHTGSYAGWSVGGGAQGSALNCNANYPNNAYSGAVYGPFDLSNATAANLTFHVWGKSEPPGASCYDALLWGSATQADLSDWTGMYACGDATGGTAGNGYYLITLDLSDRLGASQVWVDIEFSSDYSISDIGYTIDDVTLNVTRPGGATPTPMPTATPTFTAMPTATPTAMPTATATQTPLNATVTPTATRTPTTAYIIAGRVTAAGNGAGIASVTLTDGAGHSATTDTDGAYTLNGLAAGSYTLTPAKSGCTFSPATRVVSLPPSASNQDFTATCAGSGVQLYLDPATTTQSVNQIFTLDLKVDLAAATADTVDAYLNFDPAYLTVVDATGNPAATIELNPAVFSSATLNAVNNTTGQINFSASKYDSPYLTGSFRVATIRFKAKAVAPTTSVTFVRSGARWSDVLRTGDSLNPTLSGSTVTVSPNMILNGRVTLERRGPAGTARWVTPLFRVNSGGTTGGIEVYQAGTSTLLGTFAATTDANGAFSVTLTDLGAGVYDIKVKGGDTLSNKKLGVTLPAGEVNFGTLLVGDSNGNDNVNGADVSYMVPAFLLSTGEPGFRVYADTNKDGSVNGADVSALIPNFLKAGPLPVSAAASTAPAAEPGPRPAAGASLALSPAAAHVAVGDIFEVALTANTETTPADTVDAYINFDPAYLEVVNVAGQPTNAIALNPAVFSAATFNVVDNAAGQINFSASKYESPYLTGSFTAATIRFRAKAEVAHTDLRLVRTGARWSDLLQFGESLAPVLGHGAVQIIPAAPPHYTIFLPLVLRR